MIGYFEDYNKRKHKILCNKIAIMGCQTHFHGEMELSFLLSGSHELTVNNETRILNKGDICFCNPYELHQYQPKSKGEHILLTIRPFEYAPFSNAIKYSLPNFLEDKEFNLKILELLEEIIATQDHLNTMERLGYIGLILGRILHHYGYSNNNTNIKDNFGEILLYIDNNYRNPLTRDSVAKRFGYSPTYFSRIFSENFHCSFTEYINNLRYEKALAEISTSQKNKTEIILSNGFNNIQSFYRLNRKRKEQYDNLKLFHN